MMYKREEAYRYTFPQPVSCTISIVGIEHIRINTGKGEGELIDISPNGCKLSTLFDIPVHQEVRVQMEFTIYTERLIVPGILVWQKIHGEGFHYGVEFTGDENLSASITADLKQLVKQH
jgi:PilZ domain